jgi:hypothetical protein
VEYKLTPSAIAAVPAKAPVRKARRFIYFPLSLLLSLFFMW